MYYYTNSFSILFRKYLCLKDNNVDLLNVIFLSRDIFVFSSDELITILYFPICSKNITIYRCI